MDMTYKKLIWQQFGAAIDMLENTLHNCTPELCTDRSKQPEFWYIAYHTLFWLDLYLSETPEGFAPPAPFGLEELDPKGIIPETPYRREQLLTYLEHGRNKCRARIASLTPETAQQRFVIGRVDLSIAELLLYNMRHVQHHGAQLHLLLRQNLDSAPRWVFTAKDSLQLP